MSNVESSVRSSVVFSLILASPLTAGMPTSATGYWNMPSSCCQLLGYGCGAGYHAPLLLGPINCHGWRAHNEIRLPYPPSVPCGYGGCCHGCGNFAAPTLMDPAPISAPPAVVPMTRRHRPLFLR